MTDTKPDDDHADWHHITSRQVEGVPINNTIGNWPKVDNHEKLVKDAKDK